MAWSELLSVLEGWSPRRVLVVGDYMLDRYAFGNADRLAPDAPVPVLDIQRTEDRTGGSGNVSRDLLALMCDVACVGLLGDDEAGRTLRRLLEDEGCDVSGLVATHTRPTTIKHNLIGLAQHRHPQKMFRLDHEDRTPIDDAQAQALLAHVHRLLPGCDAVCLEDYGKGVVTQTLASGVIRAARAAGVPVFVDPAAKADYAMYAGASAVTPNRTEAQAATGLTDPVEMAEAIAERFDIEHVVLTLDREGALLRGPDGAHHRIPTRARTVYDVTGAGDMVLAMLAAAVANGADWPRAVLLANVAAGLEVEQAGVVPIPLGDVTLEVMSAHSDEAGKTRSVEGLLPELAAHRRRGRVIGFTNGCFDLLHAGHVRYLRDARRRCDVLIVGLNSDASIRRIKGDAAGPPRPLNHQTDRLTVLSELESVSYLVLFGEDEPLELIRAFQPDVLIKGGDYTPEQVVGRDLVASWGGRVELVPLVEGRSTTGLVARISGGG